VFRGFNKPVAKRIRQKSKKPALKRLIVFFGLLILFDVIWGLISLHAWLYLCIGIVAFYILAFFLKLPRL
jgi:hypothetical protein